MSLSPFDSFQSRFVTYLLNFPRTYPKSTINIPSFVLSYFQYESVQPAQLVQRLGYGRDILHDVARLPAAATGFYLVPRGRTDSGATRGPIQKVLGVLPTGTVRPGSEDDHSPPSSAEAKNEWSYSSTVLIYRHGVNKLKFQLNPKTLKKK